MELADIARIHAKIDIDFGGVVAPPARALRVVDETFASSTELTSPTAWIYRLAHINIRATGRQQLTSGAARSSVTWRQSSQQGV